MNVQNTFEVLALRDLPGEWTKYRNSVFGFWKVVLIFFNTSSLIFLFFIATFSLVIIREKKKKAKEKNFVWMPDWRKSKNLKKEFKDSI